MNDTDLGTAVRDAVADIHSATSVEAIIGRGRAVRARRRIPVAAGALTVAAGAALAVTTLVPAGQAGPASAAAVSGGHPGGVQLAAWTVARQANGDIDVTINQLRDPAGLQATLRADGLAVSVSFSGAPLRASCRPDAVTRATLTSVARFHPDGITIDPSAVPSGAGLAIFDEPGAGFPPNPSGVTAPPGAPSLHPKIGSLLRGVDGPLALGLVYASPQCTG